jgi:thiol:disulfide interchange protein
MREAQRLITVRVDLSPGSDNTEKRDLLSSYAQRGLPLVVLHGTDGRDASRVTGFVGASQFVSILRGVD